MPRRFALVLAVVLVQVGVVAACSDPAPKPAPSVSGSTSPPNISGGGGEGGADSGRDGGAPDGGDGGICTDVTIRGALVDRTGVVGEPPVATGGTIADGSYDLTQDTVYVGAGGVGGPTGITIKATIRIAGGKLDEHFQIGGTGKTTTETTTSSLYTATGATLAATRICPAGTGGKQFQFTAVDTVLTLTDVALKEAFTFTKR
jgi:hypothetical protein